MADPVGLEINGSLWTLRYEFMMYLLVLALGMLRLLRVRVLLLVLALGHTAALAGLVVHSGVLELISISSD